MFRIARLYNERERKSKKWELERRLRMRKIAKQYANNPKPKHKHKRSDYVVYCQRVESTEVIPEANPNVTEEQKEKFLQSLKHVPEKRGPNGPIVKVKRQVEPVYRMDWQGNIAMLEV